MLKKLISLFLTLAILLTALPMTAVLAQEALGELQAPAAVEEENAESDAVADQDEIQDETAE